MQFGINKHSQIFQTPNCTCPTGSCNFVSLWKIYWCLFIPNCIQSHLITYTNCYILYFDVEFSTLITLKFFTSLMLHFPPWLLSTSSDVLVSAISTYFVALIIFCRIFYLNVAFSILIDVIFYLHVFFFFSPFYWAGFVAQRERAQ